MILSHFRQPSVLSNSCIPNFLNANCPYLRIPPDPPGFEVRLNFDSAGEPLEALSVYITSIELMFQLAQQPWTSAVNLRHLSPVVKNGYKSTIFTRLYGRSDELQTRHVLLALYKGVFAMARGDPGFYRLNAGIYLQKRLAGSVQIERLGSDLSLPNAMPSSTSQANSTLTAMSGFIVNPKYPTTKIGYSFDGRTISSQEILTAVLSTLTTAAQYAGTNLRYTAGRSVSGETEIRILGLLGSDFPAREATRAIYLIAIDLMVAFMLYEEMTFTLFYGRPRTASGSITIIPVGEGDRRGSVETS